MLKRIAVLGLLGTALGLVVFQSMIARRPAKSISMPTATVQPVTLEDIGIHYGVPGPEFEPAISEQQALELAQSQRSQLAAQATSITAQLVLLTVINHKTFPAWIVTFTDVLVASWGGGYVPGDSTTAAAYNTEWNVVIDAKTGELVMSFSYR